MLDTLTPLIAALSQDIVPALRYKRLLAAVKTMVPCDAIALLRLQGPVLAPVAIDGLSADTLGRRFRVNEHPRFDALLHAQSVVHFDSDTTLPDPYDGLVEGIQGDLHVHDCMGCALRIDGVVWGVLTLDALQAGRFTAAHIETLKTFAELASATVRVADHIEALARRAETESARAEHFRLAAEPNARRLMGQSPAHRRLLEEIEIVGDSDLTVLLTGETGSGKELVAQALHARSTRRDHPMISINCAALPETLVESELFGHVRGAFSGAVAERRGKFDVADGGTLFLDEVGELPLGMQAKLLRVLQGGHLQRLGSDREHQVDVRVIAATNQDLAEAVRAGRFRADLYHRLSVYPLRMPALRERGRDVLVLAGFFLEESRSRLGLDGIRLTREAQMALTDYDWPGNVRELEHLVGRSVLRALSHHALRPRLLSLDAETLGLAPRVEPAAETRSELESETQTSAMTDGTSSTSHDTLRTALEAFERRFIVQCLTRNRGNRAASARELGVNPANLARVIKRLHIDCVSTRPVTDPASRPHRPVNRAG